MLIQSEQLREHLKAFAFECRETARVAATNCYRYKSEAEAAECEATAEEIDRLLRRDDTFRDAAAEVARLLRSDDPWMVMEGALERLETSLGRGPGQ